MHRSQSILSSRAENKNANKKSIWGTLKSKKRVDEDKTPKRKASISKLSYRLSITPSVTPETSIKPVTSDNFSISNNYTSRANVRHSIYSTTPSPSNSRPESMSTSAFTYSLDPNARSSKDNESVYSSSRNSMYSAISKSQPAKPVDEKRNNRYSSILDADFLSAEEHGNKRAVTGTRNAAKRHSVMFGQSSIPQDFLTSLRQIPSNDEDHLKASSSSEIEADLSATFQDYKLALEMYGDEEIENSKQVSKNMTSDSAAGSSILSSCPSSNHDTPGDQLDVKIYSNCIWIGSRQSNIFETDDDMLVNAKLNKIDIEVNEDLNGVFSDGEDDEEDHKRNVVQRTSLHFT